VGQQATGLDNALRRVGQEAVVVALAHEVAKVEVARLAAAEGRRSDEDTLNSTKSDETLNNKLFIYRVPE
jgi:hypothetical protein